MELWFFKVCSVWNIQIIHQVWKCES
jgi:hypothetical protein